MNLRSTFPHTTSEGQQLTGTSLTHHIPYTGQEGLGAGGQGSYRALSAGSERRGTLYLILYEPRNVTLGFYLSVSTPVSRCRMRAPVRDCL